MNIKKKPQFFSLLLSHVERTLSKHTSMCNRAYACSVQAAMCFVINKVAKPIRSVRVTYTSRTITVLFLMEIIDPAVEKQAERGSMFTLFPS